MVTRKLDEMGKFGMVVVNVRRADAGTRRDEASEELVCTGEHD